MNVRRILRQVVVSEDYVALLRAVLMMIPGEARDFAAILPATGDVRLAVLGAALKDE